MPSFLLEIGVEELPAFAVQPALEQLRSGLLTRLTAERLPIPESSIETFATPRRLSVRINDALPERQQDAEVEARGPSAKAAFDSNGAPTRALIGFATKQGVSVESIVVEGEYVVARRVEPGRAVSDVLTAVVPEIVRALTFPKFLRWGEGNFRFGRPLRRIVALLDDSVVPIEIEGIHAGRETVGHRYVPGVVTIDSPNSYESALHAASVEVHAEARRARIVEDANRLAGTVGGKAILPDSLVTENVFLTEWTTGVLGTFDSAYLSLPRAVLTTSMAKNQRYFPVEGPDGTLKPHFIAIRNGGDTHIGIVRSGYEKVLASRFNDARFFFENDRRTRLEDKLPKTGRIVFQEKLGTLEQKTRRIAALMESTGLFTWTGNETAARRAVILSKADLASEIVAELPSLQGLMGQEFARLDGEDGEVEVALYEQYLPKASGDVLPTSRIGTAMSLADRVDTLVGYMSYVGAEPKGSSDPFGLKRAASAIVDLLARDSDLPALSTLIAAAEAGYDTQGVPRAEKPGDLLALLETRVRGVLEERGIRLDVVEAALAVGYADKPLAQTIARADVLQRRLVGNRETDVLLPATRIRNILRSVKETVELFATYPDAASYTNDFERAMTDMVVNIEDEWNACSAASDFDGLMDLLAKFNTPVNEFFENVMVMAEEDSVRHLRLFLLKRADSFYSRLADFSRITAE